MRKELRRGTGSKGNGRSSMTSFGMHVSNLPSGASLILLLAKNMGETNIRKEIQQWVWTSGYSYTSFPKLPYLDWGPNLNLRYVAVSAARQPIGDLIPLNWYGLSGDQNWKLQYGGGLLGDTPRTDLPFAKITRFNLPLEALPGENMSISAIIKNTSPTGGYVYARFRAFIPQEVDLGQDIQSLWLEPGQEITFNPYSSLQMPDLVPGSIVFVRVDSFLGFSGNWYGSEFSEIPVWTKAPAQFRNLSGAFV